MWYGELDPECKEIELKYVEAFNATNGPLVSDEAKEHLAEMEAQYTRCQEKHLLGTLRDAMRLAGFGISGNGSLRQLAAQIDDGPTRLRQIMLKVLKHNSLDRIEHFVVLMLENRSFDHMLGLLASHGVDPNTGEERHPLQGIESLKGELCDLNGLTKNHSAAYENVDVDGTSHRPGGPAHFSLTVDPGHEHKSTKRQLIGEVTFEEKGAVFVGTSDETIFRNNLAKDSDIKNKGFAYYYPTDDPAVRKERRLMAEAAMECFLPEQLPVMSQLAQEFAICDAWFSSMPGPTCPNRFFVHAATSDGLIEDVGAVINSFIDGYSFDNGTLFDKLDDLGKSWKVFAVDGIINQANLLEGVDYPTDILEFETRADLAQLFEKERPFYTFIEPEYVGFDPLVAEVNAEVDVDLGDLGVDVNVEVGLTPSGYVGGSSMHPCGDVRDGERLIKHVYEALRNSTLWEKSALIILFDEHGGFFDHVPPPTAVSPDGKSQEDDTGLKFNFKRLGVRVPALVISPWVNKGTIDKVQHDHTSVIQTISQRTDGFSLTKRDWKAPGLSHVFRAFKPRVTKEEAPEVLKSYVSKSDGEWARIQGVDASKATEPRTALPPSKAAIKGGLDETRPMPIQRLPDVMPLTQLPATNSWVPALVAAYKKTHQRQGLAGAPSAGIPQVASPTPGIPQRRVDTLGDARALYDETRKRLEQMHGSKVRPKQRIRLRPKFGVKKP
jgi:phospholipase C